MLKSKMVVSALEDQPLVLILEPTGMEYLIPAGEEWSVEFIGAERAADNEPAMNRWPHVLWSPSGVVLHATFGGHIRVWDQNGTELQV